MAKLKEIIGEDLFKQLSAEKQKEFEGKDLENISEGAYIPKSRFDQVNKEAKDYKKQVEERDTQITTLKEDYKDVDGLKDKLATLEKDNKTQKETYEKQLGDIAFNNVLDKKLSDFKVKDKEVIIALLKKDNLKLDGNDIIGLKEQVEAFKTDREYLFEKEIAGTGSFQTGRTPGGKETTVNENIATTLGKQKAESLKTKSITDFAK